MFDNHFPIALVESLKGCCLFSRGAMGDVGLEVGEQGKIFFSFRFAHFAPVALGSLAKNQGANWIMVCQNCNPMSKMSSVSDVCT